MTRSPPCAKKRREKDVLRSAKEKKEELHRVEAVRLRDKRALSPPHIDEGEGKARQSGGPCRNLEGVTSLSGGGAKVVVMRREGMRGRKKSLKERKGRQKTGGPVAF